MSEQKVFFDNALNDPPEIPPELDRWNWGAFLLNWIWGIGNSVWIALLMFVPFVNFVMLIVLGLRGSRWAWKNRAWRDVEHFRKVQRRWATAGILVWLVAIAGTAALVFGAFAALRHSEPYQMTMETARGDQRIVRAIGEDFVAGTFVTGTISSYGDGTGGAAFAIPVSGSAGEGTIYSRSSRSNGAWQIRSLALVREGQAPIVIIGSGEEDSAI